MSTSSMRSPLAKPPDIDTILRLGTPAEAGAEFERLTGFSAHSDILVHQAVAARNWAFQGHTRADKLRVWMDAVSDLVDAMPEAPEDPSSVQWLGSAWLTILPAARGLLSAFAEVQSGVAFASSIAPDTGGRRPDSPGSAFAFALVWLWSASGRPRLTPGPVALLARACGVDTQEEIRARLHPQRRWKHLLGKAEESHGTGTWRTTSPETMHIHMLMLNYGGTPESVIATVLSPGYLDGVRARQAGVTTGPVDK